MSKNVNVNGVDYTGVSQVQLKTTAGGTALFKDVDEITEPSGSVTITENGTHNVSAYAQAVVSVASSGEGADNYEDFVKLLVGYTPTLDEDLHFTIPDGVTVLRESALSRMYPDSVKGIVYITLPDSIEEIRSGVFGYNPRICIGQLPPNLKKIDGNFAAYATSLFGDKTELEIPASLETLGALAFYQCSSGAIATITFKGTPTTIANNAMQNANIKTINVPWAEGAVANAPWGATSATINYNYTGA